MAKPIQKKRRAGVVLQLLSKLVCSQAATPAPIPTSAFVCRFYHTFKEEVTSA